MRCDNVKELIEKIRLLLDNPEKSYKIIGYDQRMGYEDGIEDVIKTLEKEVEEIDGGDRKF